LLVVRAVRDVDEITQFGGVYFLVFCGDKQRGDADKLQLRATDLKGWCDCFDVVVMFELVT
jgi:hypothetical protein